MILANQKTVHRLLAAPVASALILTTPHASFAFQVAEPLRMDTNINEAQVLQAQKAWCAGLLSISQAYSTGGFAKAKATANQVLDQAYAYQYGPVAFKPTLTTAPQTFRATKAGALAYFVGGDPSYPNDKGFAIKPWKSCEVRNQVIQLHGMFATTMGNVDLTDAKGAVTTVDKTWTFIREPDSSIRIVLHHSSLPFSAAK
ncbi:MAG: phosphoribosyl-AMP cyclohydrolase [Cyanobacteriota bacterium]|jgi:hypothetical protein